MTVNMIRETYYQVKNNPQKAIDDLMETLTDKQQYLLFELIIQGHGDLLHDHLAEL